MKQTFNLDTLNQIRGALNVVESTKENIKKGVANSVEVAEESNAPKLIASSKDVEEISANLLAAIDEVVERGQIVLRRYEKLAESV